MCNLTNEEFGLFNALSGTQIPPLGVVSVAIAPPLGVEQVDDLGEASESEASKEDPVDETRHLSANCFTILVHGT